MNQFIIREIQPLTDSDQVITLWKAVFNYDAPHNQPELSLKKKLAMNDGLLFVASDGNRVIGTVMAGYDGHRGWIYSVAVYPENRKNGIGRALMEYAEAALRKSGCVKINLQIRENNKEVVRFYEKLGYTIDPIISMGKVL